MLAAAGALAVMFSHQAAAQSAKVLVTCRADLAPLGPGSVTVQITRLRQGAMQAEIEGKVTNPNVRMDEYPIRPNLDLKTDAYSPAAATLNAGETSLVHVQSLLDNKDLAGLIKIPFALKQVKRMRIFDLQGKQDKFGGTVLLEAYGRNGKLLGRVFRSVIVASCNSQSAPGQPRSALAARKSRRNEDARRCLEQPSNTEIIKCAEQYR